MCVLADDFLTSICFYLSGVFSTTNTTRALLWKADVENLWIELVVFNYIHLALNVGIGGSVVGFSPTMQKAQVDVLEAGKMGKCKDLGTFDKGQIVMTRPLDQSFSKTAALVGCSRSAVSRFSRLGRAWESGLLRFLSPVDRVESSRLDSNHAKYGNRTITHEFKELLKTVAIQMAAHLAKA
ncbi:hypothetical protein QTP70_005377 [Hemibagrus guttatus]|uniref:Uncharacterized protein n=1 Tax=Hemibagrus guttatus TaxID=175788 RepID=A0AAE0USX7_9TELE|nr:hypothetical protein QTP70_005377 [Hemibagrus guttatus]